jgi:glycine/D-amino acid oxidase-like deaminating enzyme
VAPVELSRREVLRAAALAAAAAATPACVARRAPIAGGIVAGHVEARGHALRGSIPTAAPAGPEERVRVLVVGGGIAGLAAAWRLRRAGVEDCLLLELDDEVGGTSVGGRNAVSAHPWGAHYLPVPSADQRALVAFLEEAGIVRGTGPDGLALPREDHVLRDPQERLFDRGEWSEGLYPIHGASADDLAERDRFLEETRALAARRDAAGRRAFAIPVDASSRDPDLVALDSIPMARWLADRRYCSPRLLWWIEYATRDDLGATLDGASAWAALHYFCSRVRGSGADSSEYLTWPEGNAFLAARLAERGAGRRRTGALVTSVEPAGDRVRVRWTDFPGGTPAAALAERVVCAVPRYAARRIVRGLEGETGGFAYSPWVVANLTLRERPASRGFPECWDNVLRDGESLGYVVATHQSDAPGPATVWTWYRPFCGPDPAADRARILEAPWEAWRDEILRDLRRAHPGLEECVERIDVRRWGHAMVRPVPGFVFGEARARALRPLGAVHFAGADLGGLPLFEEAFGGGVRAAEEALAGLGVAFEPLR